MAAGSRRVSPATGEDGETAGRWGLSQPGSPAPAHCTPQPGPSWHPMLCRGHWVLKCRGGGHPRLPACCKMLGRDRVRLALGTSPGDTVGCEGWAGRGHHGFLSHLLSQLTLALLATSGQDLGRRRGYLGQPDVWPHTPGRWLPMCGCAQEAWRTWQGRDRNCWAFATYELDP